MTQSSQIWAAGVKDLAETATANFQASYQDSVEAFKALTTVKSCKEAIELHIGYARAAVEKSISVNSALTEATLKLGELAMAPLTARVNAAVETFAKAA